MRIHYALALFVLIFSAFAARSQEILSFTMFDSLIIEPNPDTKEYQLRHVPLESNVEFLTIIDMKLDVGDLVVDYTIPADELKKYAGEIYCFIKLSLYDKKSQYKLMINPLEENLYGDYRGLQDIDKDVLQVRWAGFLEALKPLRDHYILLMEATIYGDDISDCQEEPSFGPREKRWHWYAAGAGASMVGLSFLLKRDADAVYDEYRSQLVREEAEAFYKEANEKRHRFLAVRYLGFGVLAADGIWYYVKYRRYRRELDYYQKVCRKQLTFRPFSGFSQGTVVGVSMHFRF